ATTGEADAIEAAKTAVQRECEIVVVAGGDGTINEVIQGIAEQAYRPKLGIIPPGTTNDVARPLSISRDIEAASDVIRPDHSMLLDVGRANDCSFINIAGGGKLTELTYDVPIKLKTMLGHLAYYVKGIEMLPKLRPIRTRIEYDGIVID